jgi:predicted aspartyl protease
LLFLLSGTQLQAQTTIYMWTDERGVVHYSDSMVPAQHLNNTSTLEMATPSTSKRPKSEEFAIPLVTLNNDASQKFVRAELEGDYSTRQVLMLVDTGAQITFLDQTVAEELGVTYLEDAVLVGVTGSAQGWLGRLAKLRLETEEVHDLRVMVGPAAGRVLLGMDVLQQLRLSVGLHSMQRIH